MSARQAKKFMAMGYRGLSPEQAEADELAAALEAIKGALEA